MYNTVHTHIYIHYIRDAAEKRAIIKTKNSNTVFTNYKNIILKYTTKLITFGTRRL
jgi:hypothetical protein